MDKCTHEMRNKHWLQVIQSCQRRPYNQSVKSWLKENGIPESSYYSKLRQLRSEVSQQIKQSLPAEQKPAEVSFVEPPPDVIHPTSVSGTESVSVQVKIGSSELVIPDSVSDEF